MTSLEELNAMDEAAFTAMLGAIYEHSPWVAQKAYIKRPFASTEALQSAMMEVVHSADEAAQITLLRAHPELARPGPLTAESTAEQEGAGLRQLSEDEASRFDAANAAYRARFNFPFIIAVRGQKDRRAILAALEARLGNTVPAEEATALAEVHKIAGFRLRDLIVAAHTVGSLTTHVLDVARGTPGAGMPIDLFRLRGGDRILLGSFRTNEDGRCPPALLQGVALEPGIYEILFRIGDWDRETDSFYEDVPIRFRVTDPYAHYHVPLIMAPYGYSTYRGS
jgi:2-oxo-4-hydroxy-4-carboxy-5-ureidoimidazoline decarboxylase